MKRLFPLLIGLWLTAPVYAQTLPIPLLRGPQDPSQLSTIINTLTNQINAVLVPSLGSGPSGSVNLISLAGGVTGANAVIGLQPGADANAGITIDPNGSGNIQLFGSGDTGVLQFGNQASFVSAPGLNSYLPIPGRAAIMGVKSTVQGMFIVKDWLGQVHGIASY